MAEHSRTMRRKRTIDGSDVIELTFLLHENKKHPSGCEILLGSCCDYTSSGYEAEIAERITVAAVKALRLEQSVCVVREGSRATVKGGLRLYRLPQ